MTTAANLIFRQASLTAPFSLIPETCSQTYINLSVIAGGGKNKRKPSVCEHEGE